MTPKRTKKPTPLPSAQWFENLTSKGTVGDADVIGGPQGCTQETTSGLAEVQTRVSGSQPPEGARPIVHSAYSPQIPAPLASHPVPGLLSTPG